MARFESSQSSRSLSLVLADGLTGSACSFTCHLDSSRGPAKLLRLTYRGTPIRRSPLRLDPLPQSSAIRN